VASGSLHPPKIKARFKNEEDFVAAGEEGSSDKTLNLQDVLLEVVA